MLCYRPDLMRLTHVPVELLECRIALAGVITIDLVNGALTVSGTDDTTTVTVDQEADTSWTFAGAEGTRVKLGTTGAEQERLTIEGVTGTVHVALGTADDQLSFRGVIFPQGLSVNTGDGANEFSLENCELAGTVAITGGAGNDTVRIFGGRTVIQGDLELALGAAENLTEFSGSVLKIRGSLHYSVGDAVDVLAFHGGRTRIDGSLAVEVPVGGSTSSTTVIADGDVFKIGTDLTARIGSGNDTIAINPATLLRVTGDVMIDPGAGNDDIAIGTGTEQCFAGSIRVFTDFNAAGDDRVSITPSGLLAVTKDLEIDLEAGRHLIMLGSEAVEIGGSLAILLDARLPGEVRIHGGDHFFVGESIASNAGAGSMFVLEVDRKLRSGAGSFSSSGVPNPDDSIGRTVTIRAGTARFGEFLTFGNSSGDFNVTLTADSLEVRGSLHFQAEGGRNHAFGVRAESLAAGELRFQSEGAVASSQFFAGGHLSVAGALVVKQSGTTTAVARIDATGGSIGGNVKILAGAIETTNVTLVSRQSPLAIGLASTIFLDGGTPQTRTDLHGINTGTDFTFESGDSSGNGGVDTLLIDDGSIGGRTNINTGEGDDVVVIETRRVALRLASLFAGSTSIQLGGGDDSLFVGGSDPENRAIYLGTAHFDGDAGFDRLRIKPRSSFPPGQPTIVDFEGR